MSEHENDASAEANGSGNGSNGVGQGERSGTKYPYYELREAEDLARSVLTVGGNEVLEDDLLKHLKLSRTTKSWVYKLSTAREFGILERKGQKEGARIILTEAGQRLMRPGDENERIASRTAAFLTPPLYRKLFDRYKGAPVPQSEFLANLLVREHKLVESVSKNAAEAFIASARYAGMVSDGDVLGDPVLVEASKEETKDRKDAPGDIETQTVSVPADFIPHVFQLRRDLKVVIPLPPDLTERDVKRLYRWMGTLPIDDSAGEDADA